VKKFIQWQNGNEPLFHGDVSHLLGYLTSPSMITGSEKLETHGSLAFAPLKSKCYIPTLRSRKSVDSKW